MNAECRKKEKKKLIDPKTTEDMLSRYDVSFMSTRKAT